MPTLWEILTKKEEKPLVVEFQYYNPLKLRVGNSVKIDTLDYENLNFSLTAIKEVKRTVDKKEFLFADYALLARPYDGDVVSRKLRLVPVENADSSLTHDVVLFEKIGECGYDKAFHDGLSFESNKGELTEGDAKYWRVNDQQSAWDADTITLSDEDRSGKVDADEAVASKLTYWDFWRQTEDVAGNQVCEFYIVEMDSNGFFEFWVGRQIDPSRVILT